MATKQNIQAAGNSELLVEFHTPGYATSVLEEMNMARKTSKQPVTDVVLSVKGTEFPCHKSVLITSSSYFKGMFSSGMKENQQHTVDITKKEVEASTMELLLDYLYTGTVPITASNVQTARAQSGVHSKD